MRIRLRSLVAVAVLGVALASPAGLPPAAAQSEPASKGDVGAVRTEVERLRGELEGVKGELRLIRELLLQRAAPPAAPAAPPPVISKVGHAGSAAMGRADAPVTLIEFSDYQCPFCRRFFDQTLPAIKKEYVDTGKVRYVFRDFPLDQIHPQARKAAEAARCAGDQGKYWEMHDLLFQNQRDLAVPKLKEYAAGMKLDAGRFATCLDGAKFGGGVQKDVDEGASVGVRGTPAFFVGRSRGAGPIDGLLISGARPLNDFRQEIERLLREK